MINKKHIAFVEASLTGAGQKALEYAKSQNYRISFFTRNSDNYPDDFLGDFDYIYRCDTNSIHELLVEIATCNRINKIEGITTTADFYVPQACLAANILQLPSMPYSSACKARNKYLMRCSLEKYFNEINPKFELVHHINEALHFAKKISYPIIAKPQNINDSLYVKKILNDQALKNYMLNSKNWKENSSGQPIGRGVLLESFIEGSEFSVETLQSYHEPIQLIGIAKKDRFFGTENGNFVELGGSFPIVSEETNLLFTAVSRALAILDINCGVIHTECRIQNGQIKILEINPRMAGDMMGSHVITLATGLNPADQVVEIALGTKVIWKSIKNNGAAMMALHTHKDGILKSINISKIKNMPGVKYVNIVAKPGSTVHVPQSNADLLGYIITEGKNAQEAREYAQHAYHECKIILE